MTGVELESNTRRKVTIRDTQREKNGTGTVSEITSAIDKVMTDSTWTTTETKRSANSMFTTPLSSPWEMKNSTQSSP